MPALKSRTAIQAARDLTAFMNLELGLIRGSSVPDYERMFEKARKQLADRDQRLSRASEQLEEKDRQLSRAREQLAEGDQRLSRAREQLAEKDRRISHSHGQLGERDRELSRMREQIAERDRRLSEKEEQLTESRARAELELKEEEYDGELYSDLKELLERMPVDTGGGCSLSKAYMMATLIRRHDMKSTVDIGVYRGRSLFPQAFAHGKYTGGIAYGVDPWSASEALEEDLFPADADREEEINRFVKETDWEAVYQEVEALRAKLGYEEHCEPVRCTSAEAAARFEENGTSFDLIHIDGNHDTGKVMQDVELYLPRLRDGGFVVLDDVSFESVKPAYDELSSRMRLVFQRTDQNGSNDYAVFCDDASSSEDGHNRRFWVRDFW